MAVVGVAVEMAVEKTAVVLVDSPVCYPWGCSGECCQQ